MTIEIANKLLQLRKKHGYSQEALAEKLGISRQAVSKWERAEASPDTDNLVTLAKLYNISLDELLMIIPLDTVEEEKNEAVKQPIKPAESAKNETNPAVAGAEKGGDILVNTSHIKRTLKSQVHEILQHKWFRFPYYILAFVLFIAMTLLVDGGIKASWLFLLSIIVYYSAALAKAKHNGYLFLFPLLAVIVYLGMSMVMDFYLHMDGMWAPNTYVFLSIPLYYFVVFELRKRKKKD